MSAAPRRRARIAAGLLLAGCLAMGGGDAAAQEVTTVQLGGQPVFPVAAGEQGGAALRAREISDTLQARLESSRPLAPIRVVQRDTSAALLIGGDTLVVVTPRDAEAELGRTVTPREAARATLQVAQRWARALQEAFRLASLRERARVVVQGTPLFEVGGTPDQRAARRAEAVGIRIAEFAASPADAAVRVVQRPDGAAVMAGGEVLVEVSRAEAAARDVEPVALAREWAEAIERIVLSLRQQQTWPYRLRIIGIAVAATLLAAGLYALLRRLGGRIRQRTPSESTPTWGLLPVFLAWAISVAQFLLWAVLAVFILWVVPRTRPLTFSAAAQALSWLRVGAQWLLGAGLIVLLIGVGTYFVARFAGAVLAHLILTFGARHGGRVQLRADTLASSAAGVGQVVVWFLGLVAVLGYLEVNPLPLLASAGVAGIAIGFGVQSLIRDFFTGLFILLEDQYGVGDLIQVGAITGKVERFTLRITQVRSLDGSLTSIPNGEILMVTNLSKDWSQVVLDVNIKMGENVDRATRVISETAAELSQEWGDRIQGEAEVLGVETVDPLAEAVAIRVVIRTAPLERWAVSRELRRRVLDAFRDADIQVPPRAVVTAPTQQAPPRR